MSAIRTFAACVAAVLLTAGVGLATVAPADATRPGTERRTAVDPVPGDYHGTSHHSGAAVSFSYDGTQIHHFKIGDITIGAGHVHGGHWSETCHDGYCFKGTWVTDRHVEGSWRHAGFGHPWWHFSASTASFRPYVGRYLDDHHGFSFRLNYRDGHIEHMTVAHQYGASNVPVSSDWKFEVRIPDGQRDIRGHWVSEYLVVGVWRVESEGQATPWEHWSVRAFCQPRVDRPCPPGTDWEPRRG